MGHKRAGKKTLQIRIILRKMNQKLSVALLVFALFAVSGEKVFASGFDDGDNIDFGLPIGGFDKKVNIELCPVGARTVATFINAWGNHDYETMYALLDDTSKEGYSLKQAKIDFMFLEYKPYRINAIQKSGENYEFLLSAGDWKSGDKDLKKMVVDGKSFKILMSSKNSPFKRSINDYL